MRFFNLFTVLPSLISLALAVPAGRYDPTNIRAMTDLVFHLAQEGRLDLHGIMVAVNYAPEYKDQAAAITRRFPTIRSVAQLWKSPDVQSALDPRFMTTEAAQKTAIVNFNRALGYAAENILVLGTESPGTENPFVQWMLPGIEERARYGNRVMVRAVDRLTDDVARSRPVTYNRANCRRDGSCELDPNSVDISATWDEEQKTVKALPHTTVTLSDGSQHDVAQLPDDEVTAIVNDAFPDGLTDPSKAPKPTGNTDPNAPTDPTAPANANANDPIEPADANTPTDPTTEGVDPNAPTDPNAEDPNNPNRNKPKGTPAKPPPPPRAARRSVRFTA